MQPIVEEQRQITRQELEEQKWNALVGVSEWLRFMRHLLA